jgi:hypothetical protein
LLWQFRSGNLLTFVLSHLIIFINVIQIIHSRYFNKVFTWVPGLSSLSFEDLWNNNYWMHLNHVDTKFFFFFFKQKVLCTKINLKFFLSL